MAPGRASVPRKRPAVPEDDDGDRRSESAQPSTEYSDSPKRPRLHADPEAPDDPVHGAVDEVEVESSSNSIDGSDGRPSQAISRSQSVSEDGFNPGAIVRVMVKNFVTYEKAEFFPGPHLNMVIGPNGTGKSSLVCAICLGLGYHPRNLGRASSVKEFVKHGKDVATIEIELQKNAQSPRNFVIRLEIHKAQGSQKWWLNGRDTTHKQIQRVVASLHIQVDNLCQFLPQDRVVEFASCTPVDLLHETLRAAAPEYMIEWQEQLKSLHAELKLELEKTTTETELMRNLESRQKALQADVDRLRERQEVETLIADLKNARICAHYDDARKATVSLKEVKHAAMRSLAILERESGPSLKAVTDKEAYRAVVEQATGTRTRTFRQAEQATNALLREIEQATDRLSSLANKAEVEEQSVDKKKKEILRSRQKISTLQTQLDGTKPVEFNPADWNTKIRAQEHDLRELESERLRLEQERALLRDKARPKKDELARLKGEIAVFDSQDGRQLSFLRKAFPDTARATEWLREHRSEFEKEVLEPSMLSCAIKDEKYSDHVQAVLQGDDFTCFTVQTRNDYLKLSDQFYTKMELHVSIRTCVANRSQFKPPMCPEDAQRVGLEGFAIDFIRGPEPVLAMLCAERKLHLAGLALRDISNDQYDALIQGEIINTWACGRQSYRVIRRKEYGAAGLSVNSRQVLPGRFWKEQAAEPTEKEEMVARQNQLQFEFDEMFQENAKAAEQEKELEHSREEISQIIDRLKRQKNEVQTAHNMYQALPGKIDSEKVVLARYEKEQEETRNKIFLLRSERDEGLVEMSRLALRYTDAIKVALDMRESMMEASIRFIEAQSDVVGLESRVQEITQQLEDGRAALTEAHAAFRKARLVATKAKEAAEALLSQQPDRREVLMTLFAGKTAEELDDEVAAEEAKLELVHAINPAVLRNYDRQAREIAALRAKMDASAGRVDQVGGEIAKIRAEWEPQLDELVAKINTAFENNFNRISCAGGVKVHKDENFDRWALQILVKFRENEALQQLDQHRQSGGERAVSTIFYLMALQSMALAPFRVVDEINQGMDPRNERMVHDRLVEIACHEHTNQYFLITPKLLPGLRYDERMRVLCIASGEYMPQDGSRLDFTRCLAVQRGLMAGA